MTKLSYPKTYTFPLELVDSQKETTGWFRKKKWQYFILQITPEGKQTFVKLQQEIIENMKTKTSAKFGASAYFKQLPPEQMPEKTTMSLFLQLNRQDGFFTLINDAEIDFRKKKNEE